MKKHLIAVSLVLSIILLSFSSAFATTPQEAADELNKKGLFEGTGTGYHLDKMMSREEAITMFVKVLGKNDEAQNGSWTIPFTDVSSWAKPYVGYAYTNGLASGTSATKFGSHEAVTYNQYLTFLLKSLGYKVGEDFEWDKAYELSNKIGLTSGVTANTKFLRGDAAVLSLDTIEIKETGKKSTPASEPSSETSSTASITKDDLKSMFKLDSNSEINGKMVYFFSLIVPDGVPIEERGEYFDKWGANNEDDVKKAMTDFTFDFISTIEPLTQDITISFEVWNNDLGLISYNKDTGVYGLRVWK